MAKPNQKVTPELLEKIVELAETGLTKAQIGTILGFNRNSITRWARNDPRFAEALAEADRAADERVERAIFERAIGYTCKETKVFCQDGEIIEHTIERHYPPDPTSMIFWLKNRQPDKWRDRHEPNNEAEQEKRRQEANKEFSKYPRKDLVQVLREYKQAKEGTNA